MHDPVLVTNPARPREHGSGFPIKARLGGGLVVVTCAHVVHALGATGIQVAGRPATVVIDLSEQGVDLAVLSVPDLDEQIPFELGRGTEGDEVELLGFEPAGGGPLSVPRRGRLADSSLTALKGFNRPAWHLELVNGEIQGGHSGGPVVSVRTGKVVGVIAMGPAQQGGRDGVAVASENLTLWADAPAIAAARPPTEPEPEPGASLPGGAASSHRGRWLAIGGGSLAAAVAVAVVAWPRSPVSKPPVTCAIADARETWKGTSTAGWCSPTSAGEAPCVRRFDDGSTITGRCVDRAPTGDWISRGPQGERRWQAHFDRGRPIGVWTVQRSPAPNVTHLYTETHVDAVDGGAAAHVASQETWTRTGPDGVSAVTEVRPDIVEGETEVTLSVPAGVLTCRLDGGQALSCTKDASTVTGPPAVATYLLLVASRRQIETGNPAPLPNLATCGDGRKVDGEWCDDGVQTGRCDADCTEPVCGDRIVNTFAGEECERGSANETPLCDRDCTVPRCGDGLINARAGEACEPRVASGTADCDADCTKPLCGDGVLNLAAREQCDSKRVDTVTCNGATCTTARCGDGIVNAANGEQCDTRGVRSRTCTADCKLQLGTLRVPGAGSGRGPGG